MRKLTKSNFKISDYAKAKEIYDKEDIVDKLMGKNNEEKVEQ